jgi:hypothetical protein
MRPNRFQLEVCHRILSTALGAARADAIVRASGTANVPVRLPAAPRDLAALARELQPFVDVYRASLAHVSREEALALARACIIESGAVSHSADAAAESVPVDAVAQPLNLTSPPPPGFNMPNHDLQRGFDLAMAHFSCAGELLEYTPERVSFNVTQCNWCEALRHAQAPELIPYFCETDERFMDAHPTHKLVRTSAIGLGGTQCDFRFVKRDATGD